MARYGEAGYQLSPNTADLAPSPGTTATPHSGAAEKLFAERGIDRVTVAEIVSATGLRTSTLYQYFSSKDDIVTLRNVLASLAGGDSAEDILTDFPSLKAKDMQAAIAFAAASAAEDLPVSAVPHIR